MRLSRIIFTVAIAGLAACSSTSGTGSPTAAGVFAFSGSGQSSETGATLLLPLVARVSDSAGKPVEGVIVSWQVVQGGGSIAPATSTTDTAGKAAATLTLGSAIGTNTVSATISGSATPAMFTETATAPQVGIQLLTSVPAPVGSTYDHDTYVRDGLAFAFMWNSGVRIYDVGNGMKGGSPANPVLVSSLITNLDGVSSPDVHNGWWFHNPVTGQNKYLFIGQEGPGSVGSSSSGDIHIVDVSDLTHPVEVGFIHIPGAGTHNFWMDEASQTLYAAYYNAGVVKIDVSGTLAGDMSSRIVAQVMPGGVGHTYVWGVMLSNGTLYATDMVSGFWALDPATLAVKGGGNNVPERYGSDQWVVGNYAYSGTWGTRGAPGNAIKIWALDGAGLPTLADSIIIPNIGTVSDVAVTPDGKLLVATAEGGPGNGLYVYDRANPLKPRLLDSYIVPVGEHTGEVAVINGRTYVFAARDPGQQQMDIFDITSLVPN
ncbi:MAG TPA: hypothetical protein VGM77_08700 [Gemmatimonadales bacterium]